MLLSLALQSYFGGLLLLGGGHSTAAVNVRGHTECPTASQVDAALVGMIVAPSPSDARDVVDLSDADTSVNVRLTTASGELIAEKRLPESLSCAERARTAAVIVAAWEVRLHAGAQPTLPQIQTPLPSPSTSLSPVPVVPAAPPGTISSTTFTQPESPHPIDVEGSAAIMISATAGEIAPAAMLETRFSRRDSAWALGIGAVAVGTHTTTVASGQGTWRRIGGIVDLRSIAKWRVVELELRAGLALTALAITGQSFPVTSGATIFDPGVVGGLRSRFHVGRVVPWIEVLAAAWPRTHSVFVNGAASSSDLPAYEVFAGVGVSLAPNR